MPGSAYVCPPADAAPADATLIPASMHTDGTIATWRVPPPRTWFLTSKFDFQGSP